MKSKKVDYLLAIVLVLVILQHCQTEIIEMYAQNKLKVWANFSEFGKPVCYERDGYLPMREEIVMRGVMEAVGDTSTPVELYLELENKALRLFCVIEFGSKSCSKKGTGCTVQTDKSPTIVTFTASFLVTEAMNKSTILATTRAKDRLWYPVFKNIKVLPAPQMTVQVGPNKIANFKPCAASVKENSDVNVTFCVMHLRKKVFVALDHANEPLVFKEGSNCIDKMFKIGTENLTLQMTYKGGCYQYGSVMCNITTAMIYTTTETTLWPTTITTTTTTTVEMAPEGSSLNLIFWIFVALIAIAVASFLLYTLLKRQLQRQRKKKSLGGASKPGDDDSSSSDSN